MIDDFYLHHTLPCTRWWKGVVQIEIVYYGGSLGECEAYFYVYVCGCIWCMCHLSFSFWWRPLRNHRNHRHRRRRWTTVPRPSSFSLPSSQPEFFPLCLWSFLPPSLPSPFFLLLSPVSLLPSSPPPAFPSPSSGRPLPLSQLGLLLPLLYGGGRHEQRGQEGSQ